MPTIFGTQAPDTGNAEIIAHYGTPEQKERYLQPLFDGECFSTFSMTEPHAGADPTMFRTRAEKDGDEWVINGWKYFSSNARTASFLIVMAVTNPDVSPYDGMSMFLVPTDTSGVNGVRGALGTTNEMPFFQMIHRAGVMDLVDGPDEVHKVTVELAPRDHRGTDTMWPSGWIPQKIEEARAKYADYLELEEGNL